MASATGRTQMERISTQPTNKKINDNGITTRPLNPPLTPKMCFTSPHEPLYFNAHQRLITKKIAAMATVMLASAVGGRNSGASACLIANGMTLLTGSPQPMLPTPGSRPIRFDVAMKIKYVAARGNTERATFGSSIRSHMSRNPPTSASMKFCTPHGEGPLLILAGAGSGKTRVLTHRIAFLIHTDQAQAGEILAITFTNKAATEMRERVEALLGRATRGMWLLTFHAACARILRSEAERLGYTRQFTIYDQADAR